MINFVICIHLHGEALKVSGMPVRYFQIIIPPTVIKSSKKGVVRQDIKECLIQKTKSSNGFLFFQ